MILDVLFPRRCPICDGTLSPFADQAHPACIATLIPVHSPTCFRCGKPVTSSKTEYCQDCGRAHRRSNTNPTNHTFTQGKALYLYSDSIKETMYRFKYAKRREYSTYFAQIAAARYGSWIRQHQINLIVPVPMYRRKERARGYNQAAEFAKALSKELGIRYSPRLIERVKNTKPLKLLNPTERKNILKKAFQVSEKVVQCYQILLVDDIYTTGATADAVSRELKLAGAKEVYLLSICIGEGN